MEHQKKFTYQQVTRYPQYLNQRSAGGHGSAVQKLASETVRGVNRAMQELKGEGRELHQGELGRHRGQQHS